MSNEVLLVILTALLVYLYWFILYKIFKSYYRAFDYLFLTLFIFFALSRFGGVLLNTSFFDRNFALYPIFVQGSDERLHLSSDMPWALLKVWDGKLDALMFAFAPALTHIFFIREIESGRAKKRLIPVFITCGLCFYGFYLFGDYLLGGEYNLGLSVAMLIFILSGLAMHLPFSKIKPVKQYLSLILLPFFTISYLVFSSVSLEAVNTYYVLIIVVINLFIVLGQVNLTGRRNYKT